MRHLPRALLAGGLGFAVSLLVACGGGGGLLDSGQAGSLSGDLDQVASLVGAGNCPGASQAVSTLRSDIAALPATINTTIRSSLLDAASTLSRQSRRDCRQVTTTATQTTATQTTATQTTTTQTATTHTTTTQTATTTSTPTQTGPTTTATTPTTTGTTTTGTTTSGTGGVGVGGSGGTGVGTVPQGTGGDALGSGQANGNGGNGQ
jgi:hypothetical protein